MEQDKEITIIILLLLTIFCINAGADEKRLSMFGITIHGTGVETMAARAMRNKITKDGMLALNPQLNLTFYKNQNDITNYSFVIDCYANPAIYFGKGKLYEVEENLKLGYMLGIYARQFPDAEEFGLFRVGLYQIIPTPSLLLEYKLNEKTSLRVNSNVFINFVDIAWHF